MHLIPFYVVEPELAFQEMRVLHVLAATDELPKGNYGLLEYYCPDPDCDCRRVMLNVVEERQPGSFLASISYGFDADDELSGPFLDYLNPQSPYAEALLYDVERFVLGDPDYVARLERHYHMVKRAASDPRHPAHAKLQKILADDRRDFPLPPSRSERVGRNDPCPCGSGKKYKRCCMRKGQS